MRAITAQRLWTFCALPNQSKARTPLESWLKMIKGSAWANPGDVKSTFGKRVDFVQTRGTGQTVAVFDVGGNKYRIIAAIHYLSKHYEKGRVYILQVMTHAEYDEDKWKDDF